ncbi:hypothetical protein TIFTF001_030929 [Ficus carica]|uniref:Uncharacterized protein n=1 Tax=Ficus carica TaxID=3494 RepID=A0AA88DUG5_FICCA|nr:hypothetical protein TIFTF001_030929 [Ficus carica]
MKPCRPIVLPTPKGHSLDLEGNRKGMNQNPIHPVTMQSKQGPPDPIFIPNITQCLLHIRTPHVSENSARQ